MKKIQPHDCNWCQQCDVELVGRRPEITCGVVEDVKRDVLYLRPYTKRHAYPMEDAVRAGDSWEDWNEDRTCPFFEFCSEDFTFTCPSCRGNGCRSCGNSGNDVVLPRMHFPWN